MSGKSDPILGGFTLGLLTVLVIVICGAMLGQKLGNTPDPAPTSDRPVVIVPQP